MYIHIYIYMNHFYIYLYTNIPSILSINIWDMATSPLVTGPRRCNHSTQGLSECHGGDDRVVFKPWKVASEMFFLAVLLYVTWVVCLRVDVFAKPFGSGIVHKKKTLVTSDIPCHSDQLHCKKAQTLAPGQCPCGSSLQLPNVCSMSQ